MGDGVRHAMGRVMDDGGGDDDRDAVHEIGAQPEFFQSGQLAGRRRYDLLGMLVAMAVEEMVAVVEALGVVRWVRPGSVAVERLRRREHGLLRRCLRR